MLTVGHVGQGRDIGNVGGNNDSDVIAVSGHNLNQFATFVGWSG